jgi:hypothetical protein
MRRRRKKKKKKMRYEMVRKVEEAWDLPCRMLFS